MDSARREQFGVLFAAEVLRPEQFLQADNLRASGGRFANLPLGFLEILVRVGSTAHLDQADTELSVARGLHSSIVLGGSSVRNYALDLSAHTRKRSVILFLVPMSPAMEEGGFNCDL